MNIAATTAMHVITGIILGALVTGALCKIIMDEMDVVHAADLKRVTQQRDLLLDRGACEAELQFNRGFAAGAVAAATVKS